jgi:hypothetical protein
VLSPTGENMKNLINIAIVSLTLLISNYALADFQDGLNAYDKQDYDAAFEEWPVSTKTAIFAGLTSGAMSCPKLKIGFVSSLN